MIHLVSMLYCQMLKYSIKIILKFVLDVLVYYTKQLIMKSRLLWLLSEMPGLSWLVQPE